MAGTHYGALNFTLEEEKKPQSSLRKSGAIAAVVVAVCVMFFAGRVHKSLTTPFTHEDVMNVASTCGKGQFIGACQKCQRCQKYEYANGGCTWFKDTFCSYCDPVAHCNRINQICTDPKDKQQKKTTTTCTKCDCDKPPTAYEQKTLEQIEYYRRDWSKKKQKRYGTVARPVKSMVFSCFFNGGQPWSAAAKNTNAKVPKTECRACTVCPTRYYQTQECNPAKNQDTQCRRCRVCKNFQYTSKKCEYASNTQCGQCLNCDQYSVKKSKFTYMAKGQECSSAQNQNVYKVGSPGVCKDCSTDRSVTLKKYFVERACHPGIYTRKCAQDKYDNKLVCGSVYEPGSAHDLKAKKCGGCKPGEYISTPCAKGIESAAKCAGRFKYNKDNSKTCGPFKKGHKDICTACSLNAGCDKKSKSTVAENCQTGQYSANKEQYFQFRTRRCNNKVDQDGDATYGTCQKCKSYEYEARNCAAQCVVRRKSGRCSNTNKVCVNDGNCKNGGYCKGLCGLKKVVDGKPVIGSDENGKMAVNRRGVKEFCKACPDLFVAGVDQMDRPVLKPSQGLKNLCPKKFKICSYAPDWKKKSKVDSNGMTLPPGHSTCSGNCNNLQKKKFDNCCKQGALGPACEWKRFNKQCRTSFMEGGKRKGLPYRKRTKKTGNYKGFRPKGLTALGARHKIRPLTGKATTKENAHFFVRWCKQLCEDFPKCTMFQVNRCLVDGKCGVQDSTECDLFKDSDQQREKDHAAPLDKDLLKKMKSGAIKDTDWTCAMGASVAANYRSGKSAVAGWEQAGFFCNKGDKTGVKLLINEKTVDGVNRVDDAKCGTVKCKGAEAACCVKNTNVCFTKPQYMIKHQRG